MVKKGQKPDIVSYSIMLQAYAADGCLVDMTNLFNLMIRGGILPHQRIFNIVINAYAKLGMMAEAMQEMRQQGVEPDAISYTTLVSAFCRMGRLNDALDILNQIADQGVQPAMDVYQCLVLGLCTHGDLMKAKKFISKMINKGMRPKNVFFMSVINTLCKEGRVTEAQDMFGFIIHIGCQPDLSMYSSLMDGYCLVGNMKKALRVLEHFACFARHIMTAIIIEIKVHFNKDMAKKIYMTLNPKKKEEEMM